eukprot:COSAG06_NODE_7_length_38054_cov_37.302569_17_plen_137_part_00
MEWILTKWSAPGPWQNEARQLMPQGVDGFASYWVETVANMSAVGLCPEHLDLMNEPDSNGQWSLVRKHTAYHPFSLQQSLRLSRACLGNSSIVCHGTIVQNDDVFCRLVAGNCPRRVQQPGESSAQQARQRWFSER